MHFIFCVSGMITRSPGSTTGMSRTKPARVMRRTTSLSSEMEMVFITMSSRPGKSLVRGEACLLLHFSMKKGRFLMGITAAGVFRLSFMHKTSSTFTVIYGNMLGLVLLQPFLCPAGCVWARGEPRPEHSRPQTLCWCVSTEIWTRKNSKPRWACVFFTLLLVICTTNWEALS